MKSRRFVPFKNNVCVLVLNFADVKMLNHKSVYGNKTHMQFGENRLPLTLKCRIKVVWVIPAVETVPEVPAGLFLRHNQLLLKCTLHGV